MEYKNSLSNFFATYLTLFCLVFASHSLYSQCPTVTDTNITTCSFDGTTVTVVSDLITLAGVSGGNPNIEWYDSLVGGNMIPMTNILIDGIYYLDTDTAECAPRIAITVTVDGEGTPSDFIGFAVGRCNGDTLADAESSFATLGDDILWYTSMTGGTPLIESTQVLTTTTYFISYIENGCESRRSSMQYIIIPAQDPIIVAPDPICLLAGVNITVGELDAYVTNAGGFNITWYDTENDAINEINPLLDTEIVIDLEDYWCVIETSPCPSNPAVFIPNLEIQPETGTPNPDGPFCETEGQANTLPTNADLTTMLTGTVDPGGVWTEDSGTSELANASDTTINIQNIYNTLGAGTYCFTYTVENGTPPDLCISSTSICIQIDPILVAGTTEPPLVICETNLAVNSPTNLFDLLTGEDSGGTWSDDTGSCVDLTDPTTVDITCLTPGTYTYTYTVNQTNACPPESETVTITITEAPILVSTNPPPFCITDIAGTLDLFTLLTTDSSGGTGIWTDTNTTGALTLPGTVDVDAIILIGDGSYTFTYTVDNGAGCINTTTVVITIEPILVPGTATAPLVICETNLAINSPTNLLDLLTGEDNGGTWSDDTGSCVDLTDPTIVDITCLTPGTYTYTYTVNQSNSCPLDSETVTITITEAPILVSTNPPPFCISDPAGSIDLFTFLTTDSSGGTGIWTDTSATGALTLPSTVNVDAIILLGDGSYTFTYTVDNGGGCIDTTTVIITIEPIPLPINGTIPSICKVDLVNGLFPFTTLDSQMTTGDPITTDWSVIIPTPISTLIDPLTGEIDWAAVIANAPDGTSTTFTYQAISNTAVTCTPEIGTLSFTITDVPAQVPTALNFVECEVFTIQDMIDAAFPIPTPGTIILAYDVITGGIPLDPTIEIPVGGPYNYYFTNQDISSGCESNPRTLITISINANVNSGLLSSTNICTTDTATVDLFTLLGGTPDNGGTWSGPVATTNGDLGTLDPTLLSDATHIFTYTVSGIVPCPDETTQVFVTISPLPNGGTDGPDQTLCSTSAPINLFDLLGNTPDTGGTWSPVLASGTNIFNPSLDTTGIYTYTISNVCGTASPAAQINVTVNQTPIIDTPTAVQVCDSFTFSMITGMNLSGNEAYYTMTNGGGTQYNNGDVFTPALAGVYTFFLYDETGTTPNCIDEVSFTVTVTSTPIIDVIANPIDQCDNFTLPNITGSNLTGNEAFYTLPNGGGTQYTTGAVFTPTTTGVYTFYAYDETGTTPNCFDEVSFDVLINVSPDAGTNGTSTICISDPSFDLTTLLGTPDAGGTWSPLLISGTNIFNPAVDPAGIYTYTVSGTAPCVDDSSTATIVLQNPGTPSVSDQSFCLIDNPTVADLTVSGIGGYVWYDTDTSTTPLSSTDPLIDQEEYWVSQNNGCESLRVMMTVTINDPGTPDINIGGNLFCIIDNPTLVELEAEVININNYTVVWYDSMTGGNILNSTTPLVNQQTYYASFTFLPCESSVRFPIIADLTDCDDQILLIPDGFSPNDDGMNDVYIIQNIDILFPNYSLEIYNRYGSKVYEGNISTDPFDGKSNQAQFLSKDILPTGVYYYIIEFNSDSRKPEQGRLYLSR